MVRVLLSHFLHTGFRGKLYPGCSVLIVLSVFFPGSSCPHIKQFTFPNRSPAPKPLTQGLLPGASGYNLLPFIELFEQLKSQFWFFIQSRHKTLQTVVLVGINIFHSLECIHFRMYWHKVYFSFQPFNFYNIFSKILSNP